ncbi:MAG: hypothetical protein JWP25_5014 [Bradyrhizobium sp.]|nr:hypothetical protein [Bradyrhizobium sp.]
MGLRGGCQIDEDRDEDQNRVPEQTDEAERECDPLADHRRDLRGAHEAEPR